MNALNFGVKRSDQCHGGVTCWNRHCTGRGIQYSTSRVELDFVVLMMNYFWATAC